MKDEYRYGAGTGVPRDVRTGELIGAGQAWTSQTIRERSGLPPGLGPNIGGVELWELLVNQAAKYEGSSVSPAASANAYQVVLFNETEQRVRAAILFRDPRNDNHWMMGGWMSVGPYRRIRTVISVYPDFYLYIEGTERKRFWDGRAEKPIVSASVLENHNFFYSLENPLQGEGKRTVTLFRCSAEAYGDVNIRVSEPKRDLGASSADECDDSDLRIPEPRKSKKGLLAALFVGGAAVATGVILLGKNDQQYK